MELTEEQYNQLLRYVDGEMTADQEREFENLLRTNDRLADEVQFYKQVLSLGASVNQKLDFANLVPDEKKVDDEVWNVITSARTQWEDQHETGAKLKSGFSASQRHNHPPETSAYESSREENSIVRIRPRTWLVAAAILGIVSLAIFWWLGVNTAEKERTAGIDKVDPPVENKNEQPDATTSVVDDPPAGQELSSKEAATDENGKKPRTRVDKGRSPLQISAENRRALFASNFTPDAPPPDADGRLSIAFDYYVANDLENALQALERSEGMIKRGTDDRKDETQFYTRYYRAQIYLMLDSTSEAITLLKNALSITPNELWNAKTKWYMALSNLKEGNVRQARQLLAELSKDEAAGEYKERAASLASELEFSK